MKARRPVLLAVAHGSRDPAATDAVLGLTAQVARLAPGVGVRTAFIEIAQPDLGTALAAAVRDAGDVVIVPLLLSTGYHVRHDIAGAAASVAVTTATTQVAAPATDSPGETGLAADARTGRIGRAGRVHVAAPLGPDARLVPALADRLAEAGAPAGTPIVLAAAGSSDSRAVADTQRQAELLAGHLGVPVVAAYLSARRPTVDEAVATLSARTGGSVAVAAYLLAPGLFHDRLRRSTAAWVSTPLAGHPAVADLVLRRYGAAWHRDHDRGGLYAPTRR
jgi:sirohydrochlorin ferrochelatase